MNDDEKQDSVSPDFEGAGEAKPFTVLVVDDYPDILETTIAMLDVQLGAMNFPNSRVIEAVDGQDGLEKYNEHKPDMIVTDNDMPTMNGLDMVRAIRKQQDSDGVNPLIIMQSGLRDMSPSEYVQVATEAGVDEAFVKGGSMMELLKKMAPLIKERYDSKLGQKGSSTGISGTLPKHEF